MSDLVIVVSVNLTQAIMVPYSEAALKVLVGAQIVDTNWQAQNVDVSLRSNPDVHIGIVEASKVKSPTPRMTMGDLVGRYPTMPSSPTPKALESTPPAPEDDIPF